MKKYIPFLLVFSVFLLIAAMIDENRNRSEKAARDAAIDAITDAVIQSIREGEFNINKIFDDPNRTPAAIPPNDSPISIEPLDPGIFENPGTGSGSGDAPMMDIPYPSALPEHDPGNLIWNGNFQWDLDGWIPDKIDGSGSGSADILQSNSDPNVRALRIRQTGIGALFFTQVIAIDAIDLAFSMSFDSAVTKDERFDASEFGFTAVIISFHDQEFNSLRQIELDTTVGSDENYTLDLSDKNNLHNDNMDPGDVRYVSITLMAGTDDENAEATLIVTNLALKYNR